MSDPTGTVDEVHDFLGLPRHPLRSYPATNTRRPVSALGARIARLGITDVIPSPLRRLGKRFVHRVSPPRTRTLTTKERARIHDMLRDDMIKLADHYAIDVGRWGFDREPM